MNFTAFVIDSLAVWRLSHAIVKENGPFMVLVKFRALLARRQKRSGGLFDAFSCVACTSFWTGLVAALAPAHDLFSVFGYALSFSAVSMLIEHYTSQ